MKQPATRGTEQGEERGNGDATDIKQIGVVGCRNLDEPEGVCPKVEPGCLGIAG